MTLLLLILAFLLMALLTMQISTFISLEIGSKTAIENFISGSEVHKIKEIKNGPIKEFLVSITKKHKLPSDIKIYVFSGYNFIVSPFLVPEATEDSSIFTLHTAINKSQSSIFVSKDFLEKRSPKEIEYAICHEVGHIKRSFKSKVKRALALSHINPFFKDLNLKIYLEEDRYADFFAAMATDKKGYIEFLKKVLSEDPPKSRKAEKIAKERIAALEAIP